MRLLCHARGSPVTWGLPESLKAGVFTEVQRGPGARSGHVEVAAAVFQVLGRWGDEWSALSERVISGAEV